MTTNRLLISYKTSIASNADYDIFLGTNKIGVYKKLQFLHFNTNKCIIQQIDKKYIINCLGTKDKYTISRDNQYRNTTVGTIESELYLNESKINVLRIPNGIFSNHKGKISFTDHDQKQIFELTEVKRNFLFPNFKDEGTIIIQNHNNAAGLITCGMIFKDLLRDIEPYG